MCLPLAISYERPFMTVKPIRSFIADKSWPCAIIAHRAAWRFAPENTTAAVEAAIEQGYHFVEIDVQDSFDGVQICFHDRLLSRMAGLPNCAAGYKWDELKHIPLFSGNGGEMSDKTQHTIPRFIDILETAKGRIYIDIDVKFQRQLERVIETVIATNMQDYVNVKMDITSLNDLKQLEQLQADSNILIKPIFRIDSQSVNHCAALITECKMPLVEALFIDWQSLLTFCDAAQKVGTDVFVNTLDATPSCPLTDSMAMINPAASWGALMAQGIRHIQTDRPAELKTYLSQL